MKRKGILNATIASTLAHMGHTDKLVIADCGLPIYDEAQRIDLALTLGEPSFLSVLRVTLEDMCVERVILAEEIKQNAEFLKEILALLPEKTQVDYVSHSNFKGLTTDAKAVIRTGEIIPYANIILVSGVIF